MTKRMRMRRSLMSWWWCRHRSSHQAGAAPNSCCYPKRMTMMMMTKMRKMKKSSRKTAQRMKRARGRACSGRRLRRRLQLLLHRVRLRMPRSRPWQHAPAGAASRRTTKRTMTRTTRTMRRRWRRTLAACVQAPVPGTRGWDLRGRCPRKLKTRSWSRSTGSRRPHRQMPRDQLMRTRRIGGRCSCRCATTMRSRCCAISSPPWMQWTLTAAAAACHRRCRH